MGVCVSKRPSHAARACIGCDAVFVPTHGKQRRCRRDCGRYHGTVLTCVGCGRARKNPGPGDLCKACAPKRMATCPVCR